MLPADELDGKRASFIASNLLQRAAGDVCSQISNFAACRDQRQPSVQAYWPISDFVNEMLPGGSSAMLCCLQ